MVKLEAGREWDHDSWTGCTVTVEYPTIATTRTHQLSGLRFRPIAQTQPHATSAFDGKRVGVDDDEDTPPPGPSQPPRSSTSDRLQHLNWEVAMPQVPEDDVPVGGGTSKHNVVEISFAADDKRESPAAAQAASSSFAMYQLILIETTTGIKLVGTKVDAAFVAANTAAYANNNNGGGAAAAAKLQVNVGLSDRQPSRADRSSSSSVRSNVLPSSIASAGAGACVPATPEPLLEPTQNEQLALALAIIRCTNHCLACT